MCSIAPKLTSHQVTYYLLYKYQINAYDAEQSDLEHSENSNVQLRFGVHSLHQIVK